MREIVFKMERPGLVEVGQEVDVSESVTPVNVNYMIEPAVAMSGLFRFTERLKSKKGIVKDIIQNDRGYYVTVEFDVSRNGLFDLCSGALRFPVEKQQKQEVGG